MPDPTYVPWWQRKTQQQRQAWPSSPWRATPPEKGITKSAGGFPFRQRYVEGMKFMPWYERFKWQPDYQPSYWEKPINVARAYHQWKNAKPGDVIPDWFDPVQIEQAYKYLKFANKGEHWTNWRYLHPDDPGRQFLQGIQDPALDYMLSPRQYQRWIVNTLSQQEPNQWDMKLLGQLDPKVRDNFIAYRENMAQQTPWEDLPSWQKLAITTGASPAWAGVQTMLPLAGATTIGGGLVGGLPGLATGGLAGAGLLLTGGLLGMAAPRFQGAADLLMKLDYPAEWLEQGIGVASQLLGTQIDPQEYGTFEEIIDNWQATKEAAHLTYATGGELLPFNVLLGGGTPLALADTGALDSPTAQTWLGLSGRPDITNILPAIEYAIRTVGEPFGYRGPEDFIQFAGPNEVFMPGQADPVEVDALGLAALTNIRREIMRGDRPPDDIIEEWMQGYGISGQMAELAGHIVLDPLNVAPSLVSKGVGSAARATARWTGDVALARAFEGSTGAIQGWKKYRTLIQMGDAGAADVVDGWKLFVGGLNEQGMVKTMVPEVAPRGPVRRAFDWLRRLTPEARVRYFVDHMADNAAVMFDMRRGDVNGQVNLGRQVASQTPTESAGIAAFLGSPEMYSGQQAWRTFFGVGGKADELLEWYHSADIPRDLLVKKLAPLLEESPPDVIKRLMSSEDADAVMKQISDALEARDPELARQLLDDPEFTKENIQAAMEAFTGDDPVPWHPDEFTAHLWGALNENNANWAVQAYGAKAPNAAQRFFHTLKRGQSAVLLGFNPAYFINNTVNNSVTRAATGIWGYASREVIDSFLTKFGIEPYRFEAGVGAASTHLEGRLGTAASAAAVDVPIGHVGPTGERIIRKATTPGRNFLDNFFDSVDKFAVFSRGSRTAEVFESTRAWYYGLRQWMDHNWYSGKNAPAMGPDLLHGLADLDPTLPGDIQTIITSNMNRTDIDKAISARLGGTAARFSVEAVLPDVARELNIDMGMLRETIGPVIDDLISDMETAKSFDDVTRIFSQMEDKIQDNLDQMLTEDLKTRAEQVQTQVGNEGWTQAQLLWDEMHFRTHEHWIRHFEDWEHIFNVIEDMIARADEMDVKRPWAAINALFRKRSLQANRAWRRIKKFESTTSRGILDALGTEDEAATAYVKLLDDSHALWDEYFDYKNEAYRELYQEGRAVDFDDRFRAAKEALEIELNEKYYDVSGDVADLHRQADELFVRIATEQFGDDVGEAARIWRQGNQHMNDVRREMVMTFRDEVIDLGPAERRLAWRAFLEEEYGKWFREYFAQEDAGSANVYKTATGQEPPGGPPREPGPEAPEPPGTRPPEEPPGRPPAAAPEEPETPPPTEAPPGEGGGPLEGAVPEIPWEDMSPQQRVGALSAIAAEYGVATATPEGVPLRHLQHIVNKYLRGEYGGAPPELEPFRKMNEIPPELAREALEARQNYVPPEPEAAVVPEEVPIEEPEAFVPPEEAVSELENIGVTPEEIDQISRGDITPDEVERIIERVTRPEEPRAGAAAAGPPERVPGGEPVGGRPGEPARGIVEAPGGEPGAPVSANVGEPGYLREVRRPPLEYELQDPNVDNILIEDIGQKTDARRILSNFQRGNRSYVLGNWTGTGKTYVTLGTILESKSKKALVIVPKATIADEWIDAAKVYGVADRIQFKGDVPDEGIWIQTYAHMRNNKNRAQYANQNWDYIVFDESHALKNFHGPGSTAQGVVAMNLLDEYPDAKVVFQSATPFQSAYEMEYLRSLGLWDRSDPMGFYRFLDDHNYVHVDPPGGRGPGYWRFQGTVDDILDIYKELNERGIGSNRELVIDQNLDNRFARVPIGQYQDLYDRVRRRFDAAAATIHGPNRATIKAQKTIALRRIMEMSKVDTVIDLTNQLLDEGRQVAIFTGYRGKLTVPFRRSLGRQLRQAYEVLRGIYDDIDVEQGKTIDRLVEGLGGEKTVAIMHGGVSDTMKRLAKADYMDGRKKVIIATAASGGTGLSLHDTVGNAPRSQINMYLPWSGQDFQQVSGRSYRYGSASDVIQYWLFSDTPKETQIANVVGGRLEEMGGLVSGVSSDLNADKLRGFDFGLINDVRYADDLLNRPAEAAPARPEIIEGEVAPPIIEQPVPKLIEQHPEIPEYIQRMRSKPGKEYAQELDQALRSGQDTDAVTPPDGLSGRLQGQIASKMRQYYIAEGDEVISLASDLASQYDNWGAFRNSDDFPRIIEAAELTRGELNADELMMNISREMFDEDIPWDSIQEQVRAGRIQAGLEPEAPGAPRVAPEEVQGLIDQIRPPETPPAEIPPAAAPEVAAVVPQRRTQAPSFTDPDVVYDFEFKVVDLDDLIASHDTNLNPIPEFPKEIQPRYRDRAASINQVRKIARELDPNQLLWDTHRITGGPMIVGSDNIVESGNGRTIALRIAADEYPENFAAYVDQLKREINNYGLTEADLEGIERPVLVRERLTDVDRAEFAIETARQEQLGLSPFETALVDSRLVTDEMAKSIKITGNESLDAALIKAKNRDFVRSFMSALPESESSKLMSKGAGLTPDGVKRIKQALFAKTFPDEAGRRLLELLSEGGDEGFVQLSTALYRNMPDLARLESAIRSGEINPLYSIANDIAGALDEYRHVQAEGISWTDYWGQQTMLGPSPFQQGLLRYLFENKGKANKTIVPLFREYVDRVFQQPRPGEQMAMLEVPSKSRIDLWREAIDGVYGKQLTLLGDENPEAALAKSYFEGITEEAPPPITPVSPEPAPVTTGTAGKGLEEPVTGGGEGGAGEIRVDTERFVDEAVEKVRGMGSDVGGIIGRRTYLDAGLTDAEIDLLIRKGLLYVDDYGGMETIRPSDELITRLREGIETPAEVPVVEEPEPVPLEEIEITEDTKPAVGPIPPGVTESIAPPHFRSLIEGDGWEQQARNILQSIEQRLVRGGGFGGGGGKIDLPPGMFDELSSHLNKSYGDLATTKAIAIRWAEELRDQALLNYSKRRGIDELITPVFPYQFWYTRSMWQWAQRAFDRPYWFANWARLRDMQNSIKYPGFPSRMANKVAIPAPYLPEWAGGNVWVDPLRKFFPPEEFSGPIDQYMQGKSEEDRRAEIVLAQWVQAGTVPNNDAALAFSSHEGAIWRRAMAEARRQLESDESSPDNFLNLIMSPALYLTLPYYMATGKDMMTGQDDMSLLPITRTGRSIKEVTRNTPLHALGQLAGTILAAPEETIRKHAGLSEFGAWGEYYVDRMLANMAAEGYDPKGVELAMIEKSGPIYDEAVQRVRLESALRTPGALPAYGALRGAAWNNPGEFAAALAFGWLPAGLLPEGELQQRGLAQEWKNVREQYNAGDAEAFSRFMDQHPEYDARLALWKEPDERLRNFLVSEVWDRYTEMPRVDKQTVRDELGMDFQNDFLNSETRNYDTLDTETLAYWARYMGGVTPYTETTSQISDMPDILMDRLETAPPDEAAAVDAYRQLRSQLFPNWYALQSWYFSYPKGSGSRKQMIARFPELVDYWDWNRSYKAENPVVKKYTRAPDEDEKDIPIAYDYSFIQDFSPGLARQVLGHFYANQKIGSGTMEELEMIWEDYGKPGGDFETFMEDVLRSAVAP